VDVVLRYGPNQYTVAKWQATIAIKRAFEQTMGCSLYSLLPGVVENTFGMSWPAPAHGRVSGGL
jgi:hypothetical protein